MNRHPTAFNCNLTPLNSHQSAAQAGRLAEPGNALRLEMFDF
jgi:hypothetical protein